MEKKEYAIGEVFEYHGKKLIVKKGVWCDDCVFGGYVYCMGVHDKSIIGECRRSNRKDGENVVFDYAESVETDILPTQCNGSLSMNKTYYIGDFMVRLTEAGTLKVTSDRGVINIQPKADNAVEI